MEKFGPDTDPDTEFSPIRAGIGINHFIPMLKIGIKYCGGCNPRYDRTRLVDRLQLELKDHAVFRPHSDATVDLILAVCGCPTACADLTPFEDKDLILLTRESDLERVCRYVKEKAAIEIHSP